MEVFLWVMGVLGLGLISFNVGQLVGERRASAGWAKQEEGWKILYQQELENRKVFQRMMTDLQKQLVRIQRARVNLPEIGPQEKVPEEPPPEELVKLCAAFGDQGTRLFQQARQQYKAGIAWNYIYQGIRRKVAEQAPEALAALEALEESDYPTGAGGVTE